MVLLLPGDECSPAVLADIPLDITVPPWYPSPFNHVLPATIDAGGVLLRGFHPGRDALVSSWPFGLSPVKVPVGGLAIRAYPGGSHPGVP